MSVSTARLRAPSTYTLLPFGSDCATFGNGNASNGNHCATFGNDPFCAPLPISEEMEKKDQKKKDQKNDCSESSADAAAPAPVPTPQPDPFPEIPLLLNTPEFREVWERWASIRKRSKSQPKTPSPEFFAEQLKWLERLGSVETATESVSQSIRNGWQALFEPKTNTRSRFTSGPVPWQRKTHEADHEGAWGPDTFGKAPPLQSTKATRKFGGPVPWQRKTDEIDHSQGY